MKKEDIKVYMEYYGYSSKLDLKRYYVEIQLPSLHLTSRNRWEGCKDWEELTPKNVGVEAIVKWCSGHPKIALKVEPNYSLTHHDFWMALESLEMQGELRHVFPSGNYVDYQWEYTGISKEEIPQIKEEILKAIDKLELSIIENDGPWEYNWKYTY